MKMQKSVISHSVVSPISTAKNIASSVVSKSLSAVDVLEFGKIIKSVENSTLDGGIEEFNMENMNGLL